MKYKLLSINFLFFTMAFIWLLPFWGLVVSSIRPSIEITNGWWQLEEATFTFKNYDEVLRKISLPLIGPMINSFIVTLFSSLLPILLGSLAGYGFARYKIRYKKTIIAILLGSMAIPLQMISISVFQMIAKVGILNTFTSVILLNTATAIPWIVFFLMNFILSLPYILEEDARIDGCDSFSIFFKVIIPQIIPAFVSVFTL